jgi:hypothetical protein
MPQTIYDEYIQRIKETEEILTFAISREMIESCEHMPLPGLIEVLKNEYLLLKAAGRLNFIFPDYNGEGLEVFEDPACRKWMLTLEAQHPFLCTLLHPKSCLPLLMLCHVPFSKDPQTKMIMPVQEQAIQTFLDYGFVAYHVAYIYGEDPREHAKKFLTEVNLGQLADDKMLDQFHELYEKHRDRLRTDIPQP